MFNAVSPSGLIALLKQERPQRCGVPGSRQWARVRGGLGDTSRARGGHHQGPRGPHSGTLSWCSGSPSPLPPTHPLLAFPPSFLSSLHPSSSLQPFPVPPWETARTSASHQSRGDLPSGSHEHACHQLGTPAGKCSPPGAVPGGPAGRRRLRLFHESRLDYFERQACLDGV